MTFSATDDNISFAQDSVVVTVTAINDPPFNAHSFIPQFSYYVIDNPVLTGSCEDYDIEYGDVLSFEWYTDNDKKLGEGKKLILEPYTLDVGLHEIKLVVTDSSGLSTETTLEIMIYNYPDTQPEINNGSSDTADNKGLIVGGITAVVVIVVIILILFLLMRRHRIGEQADPSAEVQPPQHEQASIEQPPVTPHMEQQEDYQQPLPEHQYAEPPSIEEPHVEYSEQPITPDETAVGYQESHGDETFQEPEPEQLEQAPLEQENYQPLACPTCGTQIAAYTTPCPSCNTILNW
jgi:hypothetical protein